MPSDTTNTRLEGLWERQHNTLQQTVHSNTFFMFWTDLLFSSLTLPSSSPLTCSFLLCTALSSFPFLLLYCLYIFLFFFYITAYPPPTQDPSWGFLCLVSCRELNSEMGRENIKGRERSFYECRWFDWSEPSLLLPFRLRSDEEEMRDGWGKVNKDEKSGEMTKGALIVTKGGGIWNVSFSVLSQWWGKVIGLKKRIWRVSITWCEGLTILGCQAGFWGFQLSQFLQE